MWLDVVRLVAMFTVVCCHCTDPFNFYPGTSPDIGEIKFWGAAYGALLRPCVPLFVMITGALLLPVRGDISAFYRKRILRVFVPFLIWGVLYALFPWITGVLGLDSKVILDFFPYSGEEVMRQSLGVSLGYIAQIPVNLANLTLCGFGVYMVHYFLAGPSVVWMRVLHVPICLQIPLAAVVAFGLSWILVSLLYRWVGPRAKWVFG